MCKQAKNDNISIETHIQRHSLHFMLGIRLPHHWQWADARLTWTRYAHIRSMLKTIRPSADSFESIRKNKANIPTYVTQCLYYQMTHRRIRRTALLETLK